MVEGLSDDANVQPMAIDHSSTVDRSAFIFRSYRLWSDVGSYRLHREALCDSGTVYCRGLEQHVNGSFFYLHDTIMHPVPTLLYSPFMIYPLTPSSMIRVIRSYFSSGSIYTLDTWTPSRSVGQDIVLGP